MTHPILKPLVLQLPDTATSRELIEGGKDYDVISHQLANERKWCRGPHALDDENRTGSWYLEQSGYGNWLKDAEEEDFVRMVGVLQLIFDTCLALAEDLAEDD